MISAVVLTHNSESTLVATLDGLRWCDEIVLVDDQSTDHTIALAKPYNARVIRRPMQGDFAAQRNAGLKEAKGEWVLFVDADEVVSTALAKEIKAAIQSNVNDGYSLKRKDILWGKALRYGETSQVRLVRLGRKGAGVWTRPVHEVWQLHGYLGTLREPLVHHPHPSVTQFLTDINDYSTTNAQYFYEQGVRVRWWHILAYPVAKFIVNYLWRLGFLDGTQGTIVALMMSFHSFLTRAKLWQLWHRNGPYSFTI